MGSAFFTAYGEGASVDDAFRICADRARNYHGYGRYTGTIAEKDDVVVIDEQPWTKKEAWRMAEERAGDPVFWHKWGPALAIRVKDDTHDGWVFFGWACY